MAWLCLVLVFISAPARAQSIFLDGFESARAQYTGGSNFIWYQLDPNCLTEPGNVLTDYHVPAARQQAINGLVNMRAAGQERVAIVIFHLRANPPSTDGTVNGTILDSSGGNLHKRFRSNLTTMLGDIKAAGFKEVLLRFGPQGGNDPRSWNGFNESLFQENWNLIANIVPIIINSGINYRVDLMVEGMPRAKILFGQIIADQPADQDWSDYTRRLWGNYVGQFGLENTVGFSMISDDDAQRLDARIEHMNTIYRVNGVIVLPQTLAVDLYGTANADEGEIFRRYSDELDAEGLFDVPMIVAETYYNDPIAARSIAEAMMLTGRTVPYLLQWPVKRVGGCDINITVAPPVEFNHFSANGF